MGAHHYPNPQKTGKRRRVHRPSEWDAGLRPAYERIEIDDWQRGAVA